MRFDTDQLARDVVYTALFSVLGLAAFALAFFLMVKLAPFSIRKELEHDQNVALAVIMGAVILGVSIIVAASIHGG